MVRLSVSAKLWDITHGRDHGTLEAEGGPTKAVGLDAFMILVNEWILALHEGETVSEEASLSSLRTRKKTFSTTLSRGGGECEFRVYYTADDRDYLLHASAEREA